MPYYPAGMENPYGRYTGANATPGARHNAFTTSYDGGLWMFGGSGWGATERGVLQDVWRFDIKTLSWEFKGGNPGAVEQDGECGPRGTASVEYLPTARHAGYNFDFPAGDSTMFIMGGEHHPAAHARTHTRKHAAADSESGSDGGAVDGDGELLIFDDIWSYDLGTGMWTYEAGDCDVPNLPNVTRGTKGVPALANSPQSRYGGNAWSDAKGNAYIFGGGYTGYTADVWSFASAAASVNSMVRASPSTDPSPSANASVSATAAGGAAATSPSTPKTIGLLLALYNANVTTDWVTVAKAAQEIPIRAIIPVPGQLNSIKIVPSHRRILHSLCFSSHPMPEATSTFSFIFCCLYLYYYY